MSSAFKEHAVNAWWAVTSYNPREYWKKMVEYGTPMLVDYSVKRWWNPGFSSFAEETAMVMQEILDE